MFTFRLYRHPDAPAGGAAAPATGGASASAAPAPAAKPTGAASFTSFREGLAKALTKDPKTSQPPSDGKETSPAATGGEGEESGVEDKETKEPVTTADPDGETPEGEEQKGDDAKGWTEDELKDLKARGLDKLPFSPETQKLEKSFREARAEKDRLATSNSNLVTRNTEIEAALHAGDVKALQGMGFDLKVDQRTPEKIIEEIETDFNSVKGAIEPLYNQLVADNPEVAKALKKAFDQIARKYNDRAAVIAREQEKQSWQQEVLEKAGVKPETKNSYKKLADQAQTNLTALTQQDPEAGKYFKLLEAATAKGGALHALGINLARAYGSSPETAKQFHEIGKGLYFAQNQKQIIATEEKRWAKNREKADLTRGGGGQQGSPAASSGSGITTRLSQGMRSMLPASQRR